MKKSVYMSMLTAAAVAFAGGAQVGPKQSADRMQRDTTFIAKASAGGLAEVELGQLAQTNASSEKVKQFGQRMIQDHSKGGEELSKIAIQKGITVPTALDAKAQATKDRLSKLTGVEFDRAYMRDMVKDHREDVAEFTKEANGGDDPEVKAFAAKMLPTLKEHLKMAEDTAREVGK
jgi:putative membrane protein